MVSDGQELRNRFRMALPICPGTKLLEQTSEFAQVRVISGTDMLQGTGDVSLASVINGNGDRMGKLPLANNLHQTTARIKFLDNQICTIEHIQIFVSIYGKITRLHWQCQGWRTGEHFRGTAQCCCFDNPTHLPV